MNERRINKPLRQGQLSLLREVLTKLAPDRVDDLVAKAQWNTLSREDRLEIVDHLATEFVDTGLDSDDEPLQRGLDLEDLLTEVLRPTIT